MTNLEQAKKLVADAKPKGIDVLTFEAYVEVTWGDWTGLIHYGMGQNDGAWITPSDDAPQELKDLLESIEDEDCEVHAELWASISRVNRDEWAKAGPTE